jgi:KDO2-lipid IV(A) lauroyltransferase
MNKIKASIAILFLRAVALLPLWLVRIKGRWLGKLIWLANSRSRKITEMNLRVCFPEMEESEREMLARESLAHLGIMVLEAASTWLWPSEKILSTIEGVEGKEIFDQALQQGKGVIILTPHIGNWEVLGLYLGPLAPFAVLYTPIKVPELDQFVLTARERAGNELAASNARGVKQLLKKLKKGNVIGILPDQEPDKSGGEFSSLFDVPALTMTLVSNLVQRTGARVVCGMAQRVEGGGYKIIFQAADPAIYSSDLTESLRGLNTMVENSVKFCPEQYQWGYKRFNQQIDGTKRDYKLK